MEVIKKINNNAAVCINSFGSEVVAIGTGIGFPSIPYTIKDLKQIQKTYYDINPMYLDLLNQIPEEYFLISEKIVREYRDKSADDISSNLVFTLADHLDFAVKRMKKNINFENSLSYDIQHLYEIEYEIGLNATQLVFKELGIRLPKVEAANIALHIINSGATPKISPQINDIDNLIFEVVEMISEYFDIHIDKNSLSYSRFVSHFQYLMKREQRQKKISSGNKKLFKSVIKEFPDSYILVNDISSYLKSTLGFDLSEEDKLYLILHVNRLQVREDCYRKGITPDATDI